MTKDDFLTLIMHPEVKQEISKQVKETIAYQDKKEKANSKQAAKKEKRA